MLQIGFSVQKAKVKPMLSGLLKGNWKFFWSHSGVRSPALLFLVLYYILFGIYYGFLKDTCTKVNQKDCTHSTAIIYSRETFQKEAEKYSQVHKTLSSILTFFLGFFVVTMMKRWWDQVSSLPDIAQVAMVLNCLVPEDSMHKKKTILRYCLLSYSAVMIQIRKKSSSWCSCFSICSCFCCLDSNGENDIEAAEDTSRSCCLRWCRKSNENYELPDDYLELILRKDVRADPKNMEEEVLKNKIKKASYWNLPINLAGPIVRDLGKDVNNVLAAIIKFQQSLESLMQFYENPFPPLCITLVRLTCWMYVVLGSFALQFCSGRSDEVGSDIVFVSFNFPIVMKE